MSPAEAARLSIAVSLRQLQASADGVLATDDPECVHQLHAELRRLRAMLRDFRKALGPGLESLAVPDLAWIAKRAGDVRDLDVLALETLPALAEPNAKGSRSFEARVARQRREARRRLRAALRSRRQAALMSTLSRERDANDNRPPPRPASLRKFAAKALRRRLRRVRAVAGDDVATLDAAGRHRLRIAARKMRQAAERFGPLWSAHAARSFVERLATLQDTLGAANDIAVGMRLLAALDAPAALMALAHERLVDEEAKGARHLRAQVAALEKAPRFWKR